VHLTVMPAQFLAGIARSTRQSDLWKSVLTWMSFPQPE